MGLGVGGTLDRRWTLSRLVARAEHASLYHAKHAFLDRVASVVVGRPEDRELVLLEARLRDQTFHAGVLGVLDVADTVDGVPYLVSGPLEGSSLDGLLLPRGALPPEEALRITSSIGKALAHIHERGLAHAALSPAGVLVDRDRTMLLDLGVFSTPLSSLVGTLASLPYSAPERLRDDAPPSPKTDVYALAAMLAEMLTGEPPGAWPPQSGHLHARISAVVTRGLDEAERRFDSVEDFLIGLSEARSIDPLPRSIPPSPKRKHARIGYVTAARVGRPSDDTLDCRTENISEGGLLIVGPSGVEAGESVSIRLALPAGGEIVTEAAEVRWVRAGSEKAAFGVKFVDLDPAAVADIRHYVDLMETLGERGKH